MATGTGVSSSTNRLGSAGAVGEGREGAVDIEGGAFGATDTGWSSGMNLEVAATGTGDEPTSGARAVAVCCVTVAEASNVFVVGGVFAREGVSDVGCFDALENSAR